MKRSFAKSQLSLGMFVGLGLMLANNVIGCGDSSSDTPADTAGNEPSGTNPSGTTSGNGGGSATSGTPTTTEGNPNNIQLDPNRDQTQPINLVASGAVQCGAAGSFCVLPNLTCCTVPGAGMGMGNTFSCAASATACPTGTTGSAACSSKASCSSSQICCRTGGGNMMGGGGGGVTTSTCESSCAMGSAQVCLTNAECGAGNQCNANGTCGAIPCTATSCTGGQICCRAAAGGGGGGGGAAACVAPAAGLCPANQRQICATAADCLVAGDTCVALGGGGGGGGGLVCTPPPCTTTSCTGGQLCCVGGQAGNNPTCSTANAGLCPNNARLLCAIDDDCASVAGTLCLTAPNGGGNAQLSCRVPPPPPGDAGVGDAG